MSPLLLLALGSTARAESIIEFKTSGPVAISVDGQQATMQGNLRQRVTGLAPGVHNLQVAGVFGKKLFEAEIELPDNTVTYAEWVKGEIRVLKTEWLEPEEPEEVAAEAAPEEPVEGEGGDGAIAGGLLGVPGGLPVAGAVPGGVPVAGVPGAGVPGAEVPGAEAAAAAGAGAAGAAGAAAGGAGGGIGLPGGGLPGGGGIGLPGGGLAGAALGGAASGAAGAAGSAGGAAAGQAAGIGAAGAAAQGMAPGVAAGIGAGVAAGALGAGVAAAGQGNDASDVAPIQDVTATGADLGADPDAFPVPGMVSVESATALPMPKASTLTLEAYDGMRLEVVNNGKRLIVVVEGDAFRIQDGSGLNLALTGE
jgi:hypothetical protein